jgi:hypothetical protein
MRQIGVANTVIRTEVDITKIEARMAKASWVENPFGEKCPTIRLALPSGQPASVVGLEYRDGNIGIFENCDDWFCVAVSPQSAIQLLQDAIQWIEKTTQGRDKDVPTPTDSRAAEAAT